MGNSGQLSGQFGSNTFLKILEDVFPLVYLAENNSGDDLNKKIIDLNSRRLRANPRNPHTYSEGTDPRTKQPRNKKLSPAEILLDLRLPPDLFKHFIERLEPVGYKLDEDEVPTSNYENRKYNYVRKWNAPIQPENTRYLIYIPREILNNPCRVNLALINDLFTNFSVSKPGSCSFLIVFSNLKNTPDRRFRDIIGQKWPAGLKGSYIPWIDIQELGLKNLTEGQKKNWLASILELPPSF